MRRALLLATVAAGLVPSASAQAFPWLRPLTERRPDGAAIIVDPTDASVAALRVVLMAGSALDPVGRNGLAALTATMVSTGTGSASLSPLGEQFARLGATWHVRTEIDATIIGVEAPATTFDEAARLILSTIGSPVISEARLESERKIMALAPFPVDGRRWTSAVHRLLHPAAVRGTERSRSAIDPQQILDFYRNHYRADRAVIIATGAVATSGVRRLLDEAFVLAPRYGDPAPPPAPAVEPKLPAKVTDNASLRQVIIGYRACAPRSEESPACTLLAALVERTLGEKLRRDVGGGATAAVEYTEGAQHGFVVAHIRSGKWKGVLEAAAAAFEQASRRASRKDVKQAFDSLTAKARWRRAHPAELADHYVALAVPGRRNTPDFTMIERAVKAQSPGQLASIARRFFVADNQVTIRLTPLRQ